MAWVPNPRVIVDGNDVDAAYTNGPITDLIARTDWLKDQLDALAAGTQLLLRQQPVLAGTLPGMPVYYNDVLTQFDPAQAKIDQTNLNLADPSTYWVGIASTVSGTVADIVLGGAMALLTTTWASVFEDGVFAAGDVFLSATTPGKITTDPGTLAVYLGHLNADGVLYVRQGSLGGFTDHVHYQRTLSGAPAGTVTDPVFGAVQVVTSPNASLRGWLPANATYFPGFVVGVQIPTGAKFGYNIQQSSETALREVFPAVPPGNVQLAQSGVILSETRVVANAYGIWWLDNAYGTAPWPVDYGANAIAADITFWTTRITAQASLIETVETVILNNLADGLIDTIAVAGLISANTDYLTISGTVGDNTAGWKGTVTIGNGGVQVLQPGRGITAAGSLGDATLGWRGIVAAEFNAELPATHLWTEMNAVADKIVLLSTNGFSSGTTIAARGHRLGAGLATDWIDFIIDAGADLLAGTDYQVAVTVVAAVNTASGSVVARDVNVSFYRFANGNPVTTTGFQRTTQLSFNQGQPGALQFATTPTFADVLVQRNEQMLVRISNNNGGNPLPPDQLRVTALRYQLFKV